MLLAFDFGFGQSKIAEVTFESPGGYITNIPEFTDFSADYFIRTDGTNISTSFNLLNAQGSYYFGAEDLDGEGASLPVRLFINDINITNYSSLEFRVHLAENDSSDSNEDWDRPDYVHFNYDINNTGTFSNLLWLENDGSTFNTPAFIDTNFDGTGDGTEITNTFTQFTQNILGTGDLLDLEIIFNLDSGDEDLAIDNIEIWGVFSPCPTTATWNGSSWSSAPDLTTEVIITSNYNTSAGSFSACSLTVNAGAILTIDNGTYIEVENDVLVNDGEIRVETGGNFVQNDDAGTFTLNPPATAVLNKVTPVKNAWYFYTYWSSPVVNETIGNVFPDVDGDRRFYFDASEFVDTNGDDVDDNANDWQPALSSDTMVPGVGYAITAARLHPSGATDSATFEGHFNTGDITVGIAVNPANTGVNWNFIGNPYPSSIDFTAFQAANSSLISGAAYFWSQATPPSATNPGNEVLNFDLNDYAVFTIGSGGTAGGVSTEIPTGYVASAQGFFTPALTTGTATFTNSMRMADITSNNQFFKGSASKNLNNTQDNKLWINLTSGNGIFNQVLISYVDGATDGNDGMYYDAPKIVSGNFAAALYTLINNDEAMYAIQGKSNTSINQNEIINLGFNTNVEVPTIFNLSVAQLQGDFLNNNTVYLKDNLLNITHNLSDGDYNFTSETGAFTDRFEVVFKEENTLTVDDIINNESAFQIIQRDSDRVTFKTGTSATLKSIAIYDLFGRKVYQFKGENSSETFNFPNIKTGIYLAKAELSTGVIITKKAIKR